MAVIAVRSRLHKYKVVHKALQRFLDSLTTDCDTFTTQDETSFSVHDSLMMTCNSLPESGDCLTTNRDCITKIDCNLVAGGDSFTTGGCNYSSDCDGLTRKCGNVDDSLTAAGDSLTRNFDSLADEDSLTPSKYGNKDESLTVPCDSLTKVSESLTSISMTSDNEEICHVIEACLTHAHGYGHIDEKYMFIRRSSARESLYIAAIIAFKTKMRHPIVSRLLESIYERDRSFEALFFDVSKLKMHTTAWQKHCTLKSESGLPISPHVKYVNDTESLQIMEYFLDHATRERLMFNARPPARLWYSDDSWRRRCVDHALEIGTPVLLPAIGTVIRLGNAEVLKMLLRYGAKLDFSDEGSDGFVATSYLVKCLFKNYLRDRQGFLKELPRHDADCLDILLRAVRSIDLGAWLKETNLDDPDTQLFVNHLADDVIPANRCGREPPELKHLARCTIRDILRENWQLPRGIYTLGLPNSMEKYVDIQRY